MCTGFEYWHVPKKSNFTVPSLARCRSQRATSLAEHVDSACQPPQQLRAGGCLSRGGLRPCLERWKRQNMGTGAAASRHDPAGQGANKIRRIKGDSKN
jgi:hypothetical protein